jgi:integrase
MKLKFSSRFYLEKRINKATGQLITENVPIFLFFSFDGKRLQYFSGYRIDYDKWNITTQRVDKNNFNKDGISAREINSHMVTLQSHVEDIYKKANANDLSPSIEYMRDELKKRIHDPDKGSNISFFEIFQQFIDIEGKARSWTKGTYTKFDTNKKHLETFRDKARVKITFEALDEKFFAKWLAFQLKSKKDGGLGHRNTYVEKNAKILKWFLKWATRKGYNKNVYFEEFNPDLKGTIRSNKIIFLMWDELMNLYGIDIPKKYLEQVRDVFCFCCFTGLRHSDVYNLKRSNIKDNAIELVTIKTSDPLIIDLNDYSRAILNQYKDVPFEGDKCLPVISNQKMNKYLKELGLFAKLNQPELVVYFIGSQRIEKTFEKWQLLSTHTGRKTFITNALFMNIPSEVVMSWVGQKDHKTLKPYYKVIREQKAREMNKFNSN